MENKLPTWNIFCDNIWKDKLAAKFHGLSLGNKLPYWNSSITIFERNGGCNLDRFSMGTHVVGEYHNPASLFSFSSSSSMDCAAGAPAEDDVSEASEEPPNIFFI